MSARQFVTTGQGEMPPMGEWQEVECPARLDLSGEFSAVSCPCTYLFPILLAPLEYISLLPMYNESSKRLVF